MTATAVPVDVVGTNQRRTRASVALPGGNLFVSFVGDRPSMEIPRLRIETRNAPYHIRGVPYVVRALAEKIDGAWTIANRYNDGPYFRRDGSSAHSNVSDAAWRDLLAVCLLAAEETERVLPDGWRQARLAAVDHVIATCTHQIDRLIAETVELGAINDQAFALRFILESCDPGEPLPPHELPATRKVLS